MEPHQHPYVPTELVSTFPFSFFPLSYKIHRFKSIIIIRIMPVQCKQSSPAKAGTMGGVLTASQHINIPRPSFQKDSGFSVFQREGDDISQVSSPSHGATSGHTTLQGSSIPFFNHAPPDLPQVEEISSTTWKAMKEAGVVPMRTALKKSIPLRKEWKEMDENSHHDNEGPFTQLQSSSPPAAKDMPPESHHEILPDAISLASILPYSAHHRGNRKAIFSPSTLLLLFPSFLSYASWLEQRLLPSMMDERVPETLSCLLRLYLPYDAPPRSSSPLAFGATASLPLSPLSTSMASQMNSPRSLSTSSFPMVGTLRNISERNEKDMLLESPPSLLFPHAGTASRTATSFSSSCYPVSGFPTAEWRPLGQDQRDRQRAREERMREKSMSWMQVHKEMLFFQSLSFSSGLVRVLIKKKKMDHQREKLASLPPANVFAKSDPSPVYSSPCSPFYFHGFPVSQFFLIPLWALQIFSDVLKKMEYKGGTSKERSTTQKKEKGPWKERREKNTKSIPDRRSEESEAMEQVRVTGEEGPHTPSHGNRGQSCMLVKNTTQELEPQEEEDDAEEEEEDTPRYGAETMDILSQDDHIRMLFTRYSTATQTHLLLVSSTLLAWKMVDSHASARLLRALSSPQRSVGTPHSIRTTTPGRGVWVCRDHQVPPHTRPRHRSEHTFTPPPPLPSSQAYGPSGSLAQPHYPSRRGEDRGERRVRAPPPMYESSIQQVSIPQLPHSSHHIAPPGFQMIQNFSMLSTLDIMHMERFVLNLLKSRIGFPPLWWQVAIELFHLYFDGHCRSEARKKIERLRKEEAISQRGKKEEVNVSVSSSYLFSSQNNICSSSSTTRKTVLTQYLRGGTANLFCLEGELLEGYAIAMHNGIESMLTDALMFLTLPSSHLSVRDALRGTLLQHSSPTTTTTAAAVAEISSKLKKEKEAKEKPDTARRAGRPLFPHGHWNASFHSWQAEVTHEQNRVQSMAVRPLLSHPLLGFAFACRHGVPLSWILSLTTAEERERLEAAMLQILFLIEMVRMEGRGE